MTNAWLKTTPLADLVIQRAAELGLSRVALAAGLGWRNTTRGLRRLDEFLATGEATSPLLRGLPEVLRIGEADLEAAARATREAVVADAEARARARFWPHLLVEARPEDGLRRPWFVQAFAHHLRVLGLPEDFTGWTSSRQVRQATRIARRHYRASHGMLPVFGRITGYRLQRTFDHAVLLNTDGTIREGFERSREPAPPGLHLKGRRIPLEIFSR